MNVLEAFPSLFINNELENDDFLLNKRKIEYKELYDRDCLLELLAFEFSFSIIVYGSWSASASSLVPCFFTNTHVMHSF